MTGDRINITIKVEKDNVSLFKKALEDLVSQDVLVGVPEEKTRRKSKEMTNAQLAYIHDKGSPSQNIPARPFQDPGIMRANDKISERMKQVAKDALEGNWQKVKAGLMAVGLIAQSSIRARINEGIPPPLKPRTIAARKRKGRTGTVPLINTAQLRNAITFVLRRKRA